VNSKFTQRIVINIQGGPKKPLPHYQKRVKSYIEVCQWD